MSTLPGNTRSLNVGNFDRNLGSGVEICDLTELRFIDAYALVGTACALLTAIEKGERPSIGIPTAHEMRTHLARMGFETLLSALDYDISLPEPPQPERPGVVVPLTMLSGELAMESLSAL